MPDDLNKKRPHDATKINLSQPWEVSYWISAFGTTETKLRNAVNMVGPSVSAVKEYLRSH